MRKVVSGMFAVGLMALVGCSKPDPFIEQKKAFGKEYEEFRRVLNEDGPAFAAGGAAKLAAMLRDPSITGDPRYADADFKKLNERTIELLEKLEVNVQERFFGDIAITLDQLTNQCGRCHKLYWKR